MADGTIAIESLERRWRRKVRQNGNVTNPLVRAMKFAKGEPCVQNMPQLVFAKNDDLVEALGFGAVNPNFGELRFHKAFLGDKVMPIPDDIIGQRKIWRETSELCRRANLPLRVRDFCRHIGTKDMSRASHHVRKAEQAGLMRKPLGYGGWVVMD